MFTLTFFFNFIKLVNFNVCGIIFISNPFFLIFEIVKDTPLIAMEPFSIKYF